MNDIQVIIEARDNEYCSPLMQTCNRHSTCLDYSHTVCIQPVIPVPCNIWILLVYGSPYRGDKTLQAPSRSVSAMETSQSILQTL